MRCRSLGTALMLALSGAAVAGEADAPALISQTRSFLARRDERSILDLVAADRAATFEAVEKLLRDPGSASAGLAEALASAYELSFNDPFLRQRVALFAGWSASDRADRDRAIRLKEAARAASREGRQDDALADYHSALETFRRLNDAREEARILASMAAAAALKGESRTAIEYLDQAAGGARVTGDLLLLSTIGLNRSYALEDLGDLAGARRTLEEALPISRAIGDRDGEASILLNLSNLLIHDMALDEAEATALQAARLGEELRDEGVGWAARLNMAAVHRGRGELALAGRELELAAAHARRGELPYEEAGAEINLYNNARRRGDLVEARRHLDRARKAASQIDVSPLLGKIEVAEADLLLREGRYTETLPFIDAAEKRLRRVEAHLNLAELNSARALAYYYLGRYEDAVTTMRRALDEALASSRREAEADCRGSLGRLLAVVGDSAQAVIELDSSARIYQEIGQLREGAESLQVLGAVRRQAGDLPGARAALEQAVAALDGPWSRRERSEVLVELAALERALGRERRELARATLARASELAREAGHRRGALMAGLTKGEWALEDGDLRGARAALAELAPFTDESPDPETEWRMRTLEGKLAEAAGDLQLALRDYRRAIAEVETLRSSVTPAAWRAAILEDRIAPYRALVRLHVRMGRVEEAYHAARSAKSRTLVENLSPPDLNPGFEAPRPAGRQLRPGTPPHAGRLRGLLRPREALLDLFLDGEELLVFVVTRDGLTVRSLGKLEARALADLTSILRHPGMPADATPGGAGLALANMWKSAASRLGEALLSPLAGALAGTDHLLIVPNGPWHGVPFPALEVDGRRLIDRWDLAVLPAAEMLLLRGEAPPGKVVRRQVTLALGDPETIAPAARLPGSAEEARTIGRLSGDGSRVIVGASAREAALRREAGRFDRIHLAAHGYVDPIAPARSHIALAPGDGHDGRLEAGEISTLALDASLVVLSGCRTGEEGGLAKGEPVGDERFGLVRAFLSAGARAVVAGLWESDDRASRAIMPALYARLAGRTPAEALALLQREMAAGKLKDQDGRALDHPFYWAGLAVYGPGLGEGGP